MPTDPRYLSTKKIKHKVRCLGPGEEHHFNSIDPIKNRICGKCYARLYAKDFAKYHREPLKVVEDDHA